MNPDTIHLYRLLKRKPFAQAVEDLDLLGVEEAAKLTGYSPAHIRRLCAAGKLRHFVRGAGAKRGHYYFLPGMLRGQVFTVAGKGKA